MIVQKIIILGCVGLGIVFSIMGFGESHSSKSKTRIVLNLLAFLGFTIAFILSTVFWQGVY